VSSPPGDISDLRAASHGEPFELLAGLDPPASLEGSLSLIADRLREAFAVDLVLIRAAEEDRKRVGRAFSARDPQFADVYGPALGALRSETADLGLTALAGGSSVIWPDIMNEPAVLARLAEIEDAGIPLRDARKALGGSMALAMPLRTPSNPHLGALALLNLAGSASIGVAEQEALEALAPQISLAVQNALLRDRNRRTRQVLEAVLGTTRNGVIVIDTEGMVSIVNRAYGELLRVDPDVLIGQPAQRMLREHIKPRFRDPDAYESIAMRLEQRPDVTLRDQIETVDGLVLERFSSPVRDATGTLLGRVVILSDITVRHRALLEARALAEENAALLAREERRGQEEIAVARAAHMLASALTRADIHEQLVAQAETLVGAHKVVLLTVRRRGDLAPVAARGFDRQSLRDMRRRRGEGVLGHVVDSRRAFICSDTHDDPSLDLPVVDLDEIRSFIAVPIEMVDRVYGVLAVTSPEPDAFGERDLRVLAELTRHAEAAVQNALLFEQERQIAETLQDALLAEEPPEVEGLEMATLYRAAAGAMVGGDLYDVWVLPDGKVAVMVGDVAGKGVQAAGTTGMVRYIAEGLSAHEQDPGRLLDELSRLVGGRIGDAAFVTVFLAVIDRKHDTLCWTSAGHPPPLLIGADGSVTPLDDPDPPIGFQMEERYRTHDTPFPPGALLVLTTDGILDAMRGDEPFGEERLRKTILRNVIRPANAIAQDVYAAARRFAGGPLGDDAALAVVRRRE
jgi:serine phosphatase RsbU (regulator of sigma subunit)/PAS domain-containing protein